MLTVHSSDYTGADIPLPTLEAAARDIVPPEPEEGDLTGATRFTLGLAWAFGLSAVVWGSIILWASA